MKPGSASGRHRLRMSGNLEAQVTCSSRCNLAARNYERINIGAILAQSAIRFLDRQKRERRAAEKSISPAEPLQNRVALRGVQDFRNIACAVQYANDRDLLCRGLKKDHVVAMRA